MKKIGIAVLSASAMAFALPAAAQSMNINNVYAGISLGQSEFKDGCSASAFGGPGVSCDNKDTAFGIFAGYQINQNFAAEIGYHDLGKLTASTGGASVEVKGSAWELDGLGMLPFANQFAGYARLGLYYGKVEGSSNFGVSGNDTNTGLTYGLGIQWDPMKQLGVRAEYQVYNDMGGDNVGKGDVSVLKIAALWRFQ